MYIRLGQQDYLIDTMNGKNSLSRCVSLSFFLYKYINIYIFKHISCHISGGVSKICWKTRYMGKTLFYALPRCVSFSFSLQIYVYKLTSCISGGVGKICWKTRHIEKTAPRTRWATQRMQAGSNISNVGAAPLVVTWVMWVLRLQRADLLTECKQVCIVCVCSNAVESVVTSVMCVPRLQCAELLQECKQVRV